MIWWCYVFYFALQLAYKFENYTLDGFTNEFTKILILAEFITPIKRTNVDINF